MDFIGDSQMHAWARRFTIRWLDGKALTSTNNIMANHKPYKGFGSMVKIIKIATLKRNHLFSRQNKLNIA